MFPSGPWKGFWQQTGYGRQPMEQFELRFDPDGEVTGRGIDMVGPFLFRGRYNPATGEVRLVKQFIGKHTVDYVGRSDGEGRIVGTWSFAWAPPVEGHTYGPFSLQPVVRGDEPIQEIVKS